MTSFTKKSYLRGVLLPKPWGCHTVIISCLLEGKIMLVCLTSVAKEKLKKKKSIWLWEDFDDSDVLAAEILVVRTECPVLEKQLAKAQTFKIFWHCFTPCCKILLPKDFRPHWDELQRAETPELPWSKTGTFTRSRGPQRGAETSGVLELTVANLLVSRSSHFSRKGKGKIFRTIPKCQLCLMVLSYNEPNPILMLGYVNKVTYPPTSLNWLKHALKGRKNICTQRDCKSSPPLKYYSVLFRFSCCS